VTGLYLLHFSRPYQHARHYLGFAVDVERRVGEHLAAGSKASPLVRAALAAGLAVELVRTWPGGDRTLERRLKRANHGPRLCPVCNPPKEVRP
jgi:hypothetical protein